MGLKWKEKHLSEGCCCSVSKPCLTLCDLMDCSTPGFPVLHYLPVFAQTHAHWVSDANQPSHSSSPPSPPAFNLSQYQGFFQWVGSLHQVAKVLELHFNISSSNEYSGLISFRTDWSPCSPRDSQESSLAPQFASINSLVLSLLYGSTLTSVYDYWKNHSFEHTDLRQQSDASTFKYAMFVLIVWITTNCGKS